jgi:hypothetical protein
MSSLVSLNLRENSRLNSKLVKFKFLGCGVSVLYCGAALCTCAKRVASVRLSLQSYKCYIVVLLSALARNMLMYCGTALRACVKRL